MDTGSDRKVITVTVKAAANAEMKADSRFWAVKPFKVCIPPAPSSTEPAATKIAVIVAAIENLITPDATAVPNTFEESFAPGDHPKNIPLINRNIFLKVVFSVQ